MFHSLTVDEIGHLDCHQLANVLQSLDAEMATAAGRADYAGLHTLRAVIVGCLNHQLERQYGLVPLVVKFTYAHPQAA